ncbi:uncharacterized protein EV420DRAFT_1643364 [Desarmillaria tabescens]|uniref:Uncharacterized protein n=1 Tax=Armillaria tabescens TaxID=1929756 RepID=A0AA39KBC3_ARMTA|nr:uncharacterized protein EV420DRAFT_1643364 [Desarmillaria tabescens]KAK0458017.1 hypothetical protein EV420DRAFT_1643364 [Desarmillaria tabescens]
MVERPTHFLSIPLSQAHPILRARVADLLPAPDSKYAARRSSMHPPYSSLTPETLPIALNLLHCPTLLPIIDPPPTITLDTLDVLRRESCLFAHVLWVGPSISSRAFVQPINEIFRDEGFITDTRLLKLHMTLMNNFEDDVYGKLYPGGYGSKEGRDDASDYLRHPLSPYSRGGRVTMRLRFKPVPPSQLLSSRTALQLSYPHEVLSKPLATAMRQAQIMTPSMLDDNIVLVVMVLVRCRLYLEYSTLVLDLPWVVTENKSWIRAGFDSLAYQLFPRGTSLNWVMHAVYENNSKKVKSEITAAPGLVLTWARSQGKITTI